MRIRRSTFYDTPDAGARDLTIAMAIGVLTPNYAIGALS